VQCRFVFSATPGGPSGLCDLRLLPRETDTRVRICLTRLGLPLREALRVWLDDALGLECAALRDRLENRPARSLSTGTRTGRLI
jgi:hypothetical protein